LLLLLVSHCATIYYLSFSTILLYPV
jgi:hypothetical protein